MTRLSVVIKELKKVRGLNNFIILTSRDKKRILQMEEKNNLGVQAAVQRKNAFACTHDSSFRKPASDIVAWKNGRALFPAVPFPEVLAKNVVSSSPGYLVDSYLRKKMDAEKEDATLIVGFD
jgi:hypothetical protein